MSVQFFRNEAGDRLAYAEQGAGPLLAFPAWWVSHLERDAEDPAYRDFFDSLAAHFRVVRYDRRGVGLSDRVSRTFTLDEELGDFEALMSHLGGTQARLFGFSCGGPVGLAYAARHPDRVEAVVCYGSYVDGSQLAADDVKRALTSLVRAHWGLGSKALADIFHPGANAEVVRRFATLQRDAADAETAARLLELTYAMNVMPFVAEVHAPVLVLHRRGDRAIPFEQGRKLAGCLSRAQLVTLDGEIHLPWAGDARTVIDAVCSFDSGRNVAAKDRHAELRRDGEVWSLRFEGRQALLRDAKGIADLAQLLARPQQEVHVLDLLGPEARALATSGSPQPALDAKALASLRRRLAEIEGDLSDASNRGDGPATDRFRAEKEALLERIAADTGLGGRSRMLNEPVERARKAISARLRDAIRRIEAAHPELGRHLQSSITTGICCVYRPSDPLRWVISPDPH